MKLHPSLLADNVLTNNIPLGRDLKCYLLLSYEFPSGLQIVLKGHETRKSVGGKKTVSVLQVCENRGLFLFGPPSSLTKDNSRVNAFLKMSTVWKKKSGKLWNGNMVYCSLVGRTITTPQ